MIVSLIYICTFIKIIQSSAYIAFNLVNLIFIAFLRKSNYIEKKTKVLCRLMGKRHADSNRLACLAPIEACALREIMSD